MRYFVRRLLLCLIFCSFLSASALVLAQDASSSSQRIPEANQSDAPIEQDAASPEVAKAEAAMLKSDWKAAEPILDSWLASHPSDSRALFDAGYLADAQGRNEDAVALYRK